MNKKEHNKASQKRLLIIGFGSIGKAVLPLIFKHTNFIPAQVIIVSKHNDGKEIAKEFGVHLEEIAITAHNYIDLLAGMLQEGDFLLNLSVGVSSFALVEWCQKHGVLYLDTCTEPWEGVYTDKNLPPALRTNYALREEILKLNQG